ncbi:ferritin-like protein [Sphingopyxis sp. JAI128]|uniref:ferritin-like protein n=1 Tax=Sphingopyxis sp. JAI128 TaxID=2723066 RepID=UPI0017F4A2F2|nr:ferritin-like protein [Sphingopyxis sp. JAI128]MBB6426096.1 hypothetical protein [Sphingopyxis sp. JAI128]
MLPPPRRPAPPTRRLTPAGYDYATIGAFYRTIEADLRALAALTEIFEEGEGAPAYREGSHFQRFVAVRS